MKKLQVKDPLPYPPPLHIFHYQPKAPGPTNLHTQKDTSTASNLNLPSCYNIYIKYIWLIFLI